MVSERTCSRDMRGLLGGLGLILFAMVGAACGGPEYPNCETDEDCKESEFCVNALCQQCRSDQDCTAGQTCMDGACQAIVGS